jgi:hypothetical protein
MSAAPFAPAKMRGETTKFGWKANISETGVALTFATERVARARQNETELAFCLSDAGLVSNSADGGAQEG